MLLDVRTYTCKPGMIKKHLALYEKMGKGPQTRHLGQPFAYLVTESGNPNQYLHIWQYENAADREKRRAAMQADPEWQAYLEESSKLGALVSQQNALMKPVEFFQHKRSRRPGEARCAPVRAVAVSRLSRPSDTPAARRRGRRSPR